MAVDKLRYAIGNASSTTLSTAMSNSDTSATITSDTNFAAKSGAGEVIIDEDQTTEEIAYSTGKSSNTLTIPLANRGLEGGSAQAHAINATIKGILTGGMWNDLIDSLVNVLDITTGAVDTTKVVTLTGTQTLTNKAITKRVVTTTDDATSVITCTSTDVYELSAVANNTEFSITGTPVNGQTILIRYKDAGVAKTLTWTGITAIGITLPTTTTASKWGYVGITYNSAASAWHAIATTTEV